MEDKTLPFCAPVNDLVERDVAHRKRGELCLRKQDEKGVSAPAEGLVQSTPP